LLSSPMDARHYVLQDWGATMPLSFDAPTAAPSAHQKMRGRRAH
jgi:hypothetical protein